MTGITGLHHFSIACSDADRSIAFYRDVFGMELRSERVVEPGGFVERMTGVAGARVRIVHLHGYGLNFELLEYLEPRGDLRAREPNHAGAAHICFLAEDVERLCDELTGRGVRIRSEHGRPVTVVGGPNDGGRALYLEDPDGNCVEVHQWTGPPAAGGAG